MSAGPGSRLRFVAPRQTIRLTDAPAFAWGCVVRGRVRGRSRRRRFGRLAGSRNAAARSNRYSTDGPACTAARAAPAPGPPAAPAARAVASRQAAVRLPVPRGLRRAALFGNAMHRVRGRDGPTELGHTDGCAQSKRADAAWGAGNEMPTAVVSAARSSRGRAVGIRVAHRRAPLLRGSPDSRFGATSLRAVDERFAT